MWLENVHKLCRVNRNKGIDVGHELSSLFHHMSRLVPIKAHERDSRAGLFQISIPDDVMGCFVC